MNLIDAAEKVKGKLSELIQSKEVAILPASRKAAVEALAEKLDAFIAGLVEIDREVINLKAVTEDKKSLAANLAYWEGMKAGAIRGNTPEFNELKANSATIHELFRAAIDITQIVKFGESQINFSVKMGDQFRKFQAIWQNFKKEITKNSDSLVTTVGAVNEAAQYFEMLRRFDIVTEYSTAIYSYREKAWVELALPKIKQINHLNTQVEFRYSFESAARGLITGDWFNAYAYEVLQDQIKRLETEFEMYPMVSYRCAANATLAKGEVDVLARIEDHILVVECKSGRVQSYVGGTTFEGILQKFHALRDVFVRSRLPSKFTFVLVYNPFLVNPDDVNKAFEGTGVIAVGIDDLRGKIIDFVQALAAPPAATAVPATLAS